MAALTKEAILAVADAKRTIEELDVPEFGGTAYVRGLTSGERDHYEAQVMQRRGKELVPNLTNARAKLVVLALCDENGERLFGDRDISALGKLPAKGVQRIFDKARDLAGLSEEDVDELEGNSDPDPSV